MRPNSNKGEHLSSDSDAETSESHSSDETETKGEESPPREPEQMLTTEEVAKMMKVTSRHIYQQSKDGDFPKPILLGRSVRYSPSDVAAYQRGRWRPDGLGFA